MNARPVVRVVLLVGAPFAVASGCLLPSFERVPEPTEPVVGGTAGVVVGAVVVGVGAGVGTQDRGLSLAEQVILFGLSR